MATLRGEAVDRPPVNFYEIGGLVMDPADGDPFNVYNDPSWAPLLELAENHTDIIRMRSPVRKRSHQAWDDADGRSIRGEFLRVRLCEEGGCRVTRSTLTIAGRTLTSTTRRTRDVDTVWSCEPLLKSREDLLAWLQLPDEFFDETVHTAPLIEEETRLGDRGLVMVDTEDPLCMAATLFSMEDYTVLALTEPRLFHRLLEKLARHIHVRTAAIARELPGRLWRIYGPEFATEPYLPPHLFAEYVGRYTAAMVRTVKASGGFARIHVHGRIRNILDSIVAMGADAIDPIEPPPHGDVDLAFVRGRYGRDLVLFGNIEVADIEAFEPTAFKSLVRRTVADGTAGEGRGFVLMPTASPFGRKISERTLHNYRILARAGRPASHAG